MTKQAKILLLHGSREGHTVKICEFIAQELQQQTNLEITTQVMSLAQATSDSSFNLATYDAVVIGASIHYGHFPRALLDFTTKFKNELDAKPSYFFGVNLTARKPEKRTVATNVYVRKFLQRSLWQPTQAFVFAGALNYSQLNFFDRTLIRFIMWITKGDTHPSTNKVYTDWDDVKHLVTTVVEKLS